MFGLGTIINSVAIIIGGVFGLLFGKKLTQSHQDSLTVACGISVLFIGISGTLEYRTPIPLLDKLWPWLDDRMRFAVFYDWGWVGTNNNAYQDSSVFLHSIGFGTYMNLTDWVTAQIGVGFPLVRDYDESTARFYFGINSDLDRLIPLRNPEKI